MSVKPVAPQASVVRVENGRVTATVPSTKPPNAKATAPAAVGTVAPVTGVTATVTSTKPPNAKATAPAAVVTVAPVPVPPKQSAQMTRIQKVMYHVVSDSAVIVHQDEAGLHLDFISIPHKMFSTERPIIAQGLNIFTSQARAQTAWKAVGSLALDGAEWGKSAISSFMGQNDPTLSSKWSELHDTGGDFVTKLQHARATFPVLVHDDLIEKAKSILSDLFSDLVVTDWDGYGDDPADRNRWIFTDKTAALAMIGNKADRVMSSKIPAGPLTIRFGEHTVGDKKVNSGAATMYSVTFEIIFAGFGDVVWNEIERDGQAKVTTTTTQAEAMLYFTGRAADTPYNGHVHLDFMTVSFRSDRVKPYRTNAPPSVVVLAGGPVVFIFYGERTW
jgi:hypothetical protein